MSNESNKTETKTESPRLYAHVLLDRSGSMATMRRRRGRRVQCLRHEPASGGMRLTDSVRQ